ncbi:MAG: hypothetical protein ACLFM7_13680 [Bacteroidales bacterium]
MKKKQSNILMIGGNARKSGKTSLICRLLEYFGPQFSIAAVKLAIYNDRQIFREHYPEAITDGYLEIKERDPLSEKDSGKYLRAGASEGWFIAAVTENEGKVEQRVAEIVNRMDLLIFESNALRKNIAPGIFIMVNDGRKKQKASAKAVIDFVDLFVETGDEIFGQIENYIEINKNVWNLNPRL